MTNGIAYPLLAMAGLLLSSVIWGKLLRRGNLEHDPRLVYVFLGAFVGALVGAKVVFLAAEGWLVFLDPDLNGTQKFMGLLSGKTVTGAILGGYLSVEVVKHHLGLRNPTGDYFSVLVPGGLLMGRTGCLIQGCCPGKPWADTWYALHDAQGLARFPSVPLEFSFNAAFLVFAIVAWRRGFLRGQVFHVYLIAYGVFRFGHEFLRDTPAILGPLSGYHLAALCILLLGAVRFAQRAGQESKSSTEIV